MPASRAAPFAKAGIAPWAIAPLAAALALGLWLAADGRLSGDEPSYLYAAKYLTFPQLVAGEVQPSGVPGFLQGRILHLLFLKGVMAAAGDAATGFRVLQFIHLGIVIVNLLLIGRILRSLLPAVTEVRAAVLALAMAPISLYFAFKTTADNEALLAALVATLGLVRIGGVGGARWAVATVLGLATAALTKNQMIFLPAAFWIAACLVPVAPIDRRRLALLGSLCGIAGGLLTIAVLEAIGVGFGGYIESYRAPFENVTPPIAKIMNLGTELGLAWLLLPFALLSKRRRELAAFAVWFSASMAPFLFFSGIEPRHVAVNLAAAGGLVALSLEALHDRWSCRGRLTARGKCLAATLGAFVLMAANAIFLAIMPHKVDLDRMRGMLEALDARYGSEGYVLLAANAYSDFHVIRVLWPRRDVRFIAGPVLALDTTRHSREAILRGYFGKCYVERLSDLAAIGKPLVFFGFRTTLAAGNLRAMLNRVSPALGDRIMGHVTLVPHLYTPSTEWLWNDPTVRFEPVAVSAPYEAFELLIRCRPCG